jgi:hypothetical protein
VRASNPPKLSNRESLETKEIKKVSGIYGNSKEDRYFEAMLHSYLDEHEVCGECEEYADDCKCEGRDECEPNDDYLADMEVDRIWGKD